MCRMTSLIAQRKNHQDAVDEIESQQNAMVWRVLNALYQHEKVLWTGNYYDYEGPRYCLTGAWNWPGHFESFKIDDEEKITATGTYYGSRGYVETESVTFPASWLQADPDSLPAIFDAHWALVQKAKQAKRDEQARTAEAKEREDFERLQKKFGVNEKSS